MPKQRSNRELLTVKQTDAEWLEHSERFGKEPPDFILRSKALAEDELLRWYLYDLHQCIGQLVQTVKVLQRNQREASARGNGQHSP